MLVETLAEAYQEAREQATAETDLPPETFGGVRAIRR
jgi:hypothetical protein